MTTSAFHLLHLQPDPLRLTAWAARHHLADSTGDFGYALHGLLHAVFGARAPRSFRYTDAEQGLLAYTDLSSDELLQATALAPPDAALALGLGATQTHAGFSVRPFPSRWPDRHVLGFDVRVRPIVREGSTGRERDAFLVAAEKSSAGQLDRAQVYVQWLGECLARQGGAELLDATLTRFRLLDVMRKTQKGDADDSRHKRNVGGPDAMLAGHLRVTDPQAFAALLARGVGRHRAFGFGLLLLRPASR